MVIDFTGKTALVTGATRGIGKAIADTLWQSGAEVYLTGTKQEEIDALNQEVKVQGIERKHYLCVNLSNEDSLNKFLQELEKIPQIDICVNNAGINIVRDFCEVPFEEFMKVQQVNVFGPRQILNVVVPKMKIQKYGRIVNIASIWSVINRPGRSSYGISKNAIHGLTKALSIELAAYNIMVNSVSPGFTMTELTKNTNTPEQLVELGNKVAARRLADPQEQANVVAFLCSEQNSYMTGQNLVVDGGYTNE
jgi:3-oxoacyl-[acyl-carrier protein] reductase